MSHSYLVSTPAFDDSKEPNRKKLTAHDSACEHSELVPACRPDSSKLLRKAWLSVTDARPSLGGERPTAPPARSRSVLPRQPSDASLPLSAFMPPSKCSVCSVCPFSTSRRPQVRSYSSPGQTSFSRTCRCANRRSRAPPRTRRPGGPPGRSWL